MPFGYRAPAGCHPDAVSHAFSDGFHPEYGDETSIVRMHSAP